MKGRVLGIYLGIEGVGVAEYDNKKLLATAYMPFAALEEEVASYDQLSSQIKTEALIQRLLRKIKAEATEAIVALPERDLTFRTLDMPLLKKSELQLALPLEIEKYIPFKLNDVFWDHQAKNIAKEKKTQVAFLSSKKESVEELASILGNINIHVNRVDAAALASVSLLMNLGKIPKNSKDFAVIFYGKKEAEICFYENGFPKFSRYTKVPLDFEGNENITKFIDDVRLTMGYYKREAGQAKIEKAYVVAPDECHESFAKIADDLGLPASVVSLDSVYSDQRLSTMYELKACSLAMRSYSKATEGYNLLQEEKAAAIAEKDMMNYFKAQAPDAPLDPRPTLAAMAVSALIFGGIYATSQPELKEANERLVQVQNKLNAANLTASDVERIRAELNANNQKVELLTSVKVPDKKIAKMFNALLEGVGEQEGMWFSGMSFAISPDTGFYDVSAEGYVYVDSPDLERESFTTWVEKVKNDSFIKESGYSLSIESMERADIYEYSVTKFRVKLGKNG